MVNFEKLGQVSKFSNHVMFGLARKRTLFHEVFSLAPNSSKVKISRYRPAEDPLSCGPHIPLVNKANSL